MLNPSELFNLSRVVHTGSFMRAAAELGISQPALSKSVARLERKLGVRLLERKARGVVATPFAEVLLQRTLPLIADLHAAAEEIEAMKGGVGGSVAIGVAPAVAASFLPSVVERLRESGRPIGLRVTEGLVEDLLNGVRNGVFDIAVTTRTASVAADEFRVQTLFEDRFVVCCAPSNPLSRQAVVEPGELSAMAWVLAPRGGVLRSEFDTCFRQVGTLPPSAMVETASGALSKALVMDRGFLSFLPRELISFEMRKGDIAELQVPWLQWRRSVLMVMRRGRVPPGSQLVVAQLMLETGQAMS